MTTAAPSSTAAAPAIISLPAGRFFRASLFLLIFTSVITIVTSGKLDLFTMMFAPAAVLYKGYRLWRGRHAEISHRVATWLVAAYVVIFPLDVVFFSRAFTANSPNPSLYAALIGAVHFLLFVLLIRFYSAAHDRDALFLAMLSLAGILAAAVLTVDTKFLVLFFFFLIFGVATFLGLELRRGAVGAIAPVFSFQPAQERRIARALSLTAVSVTAGAIVIGGLLFFFFPRLSAGYLGRSNFNTTLMSGFSDEVELGQIGEIKRNSSIVMRVEIGHPVNYARLRWHGIALTNFDGRRWYTAKRDHGEVLHSGPDGSVDVKDPEYHFDSRAPELHYTVFLEPINSETIFVAENAMSLYGNFTGVATNLGQAKSADIGRDMTGSLFNSYHSYVAIRYSGWSQLPRIDTSKLRAASTNYPRKITETYLQLPLSLDPRIPRFAKEITAQAQNPFDKAMVIETYLSTKFTYTLNLTGKPGDDPLPHFLFETRAGHCEYFASAMAVMLRTLGIPSRDVNGFLPGEYNDLGGDYIVRESDAHSWVEAYFPDNGWIVFDPTPPAPASEGGLLARLGQYADWADLTWNEWVISYDFAHQIVLAQGLQRNSRNWTESLHTWFEWQQKQGRKSLRSWQFRHETLRFLLPVALIFFLLVLRFNLIGRALRHFSLLLQLRGAESSRKVSPQLASRLYAELLQLLARRGFVRCETQTPLEFAAAIPEPVLAPTVREFTQLYMHARFGGVPCDTARLLHLLSQAQLALRSH